MKYNKVGPNHILTLVYDSLRKKQFKIIFSSHITCFLFYKYFSRPTPEKLGY